MFQALCIPERQVLMNLDGNKTNFDHPDVIGGSPVLARPRGQAQGDA